MEMRHLNTGVRLVADVDADQDRRQAFQQAAHLQGAGVDDAESLDAIQRFGDDCLRVPVSADQRVLIERTLRITQNRGADGVQAGGQRDVVGNSRPCLLGSRPVPRLDQMSGVSAHGGGEWNCGVQQHLSGSIPNLLDSVLEPG